MTDCNNTGQGASVSKTLLIIQSPATLSETPSLQLGLACVHLKTASVDKQPVLTSSSPDMILLSFQATAP